MPGVLAYAVPSSPAHDEEPLRSGIVWCFLPQAGSGDTFGRITLSLYSTGFSVSHVGGHRPAASVVWSPFSLVQACRFHSPKTDTAHPLVKLFKVSVFGASATYFFATEGDDAANERARWVADIARAVRLMTCSLFPRFQVRVHPPPSAAWSKNRLLAGYLLLCSGDDTVLLLYCELHAHFDDRIVFAAYENEACEAQVIRLSINTETMISERVGIDCSCFSVDGRQFSARTRSERDLWLRAVSNLRVKLKHLAENPSPSQLDDYRAAVLEHAQSLPMPIVPRGGPMLPQWRHESLSPSRPFGSPQPVGRSGPSGPGSYAPSAAPSPARVMAEELVGESPPVSGHRTASTTSRPMGPSPSASAPISMALDSLADCFQGKPSLGLRKAPKAMESDASLPGLGSLGELRIVSEDMEAAELPKSFEEDVRMLSDTGGTSAAPASSPRPPID